MVALTARQLEIPLRFVTRRDGEPLGCSERSALHARHVLIARQLERREIDELREHRNGAREGMADADRMRRAPAAAREIAAALHERCGGAVELLEQKRTPARKFRAEP